MTHNHVPAASGSHVVVLCGTILACAIRCHHARQTRGGRTLIGIPGSSGNRDPSSKTCSNGRRPLSRGQSRPRVLRESSGAGTQDGRGPVLPVMCKSEKAAGIHTGLAGVPSHGMATAGAPISHHRYRYIPLSITNEHRTISCCGSVRLQILGARIHTNSAQLRNAD